MNSDVQQAREFHRKSVELAGHAHQYRQRRDELIRRAYAEGGCSYSSLAKQVGCSPELIAKAVAER